MRDRRPVRLLEMDWRDEERHRRASAFGARVALGLFALLVLAASGVAAVVAVASWLFARTGATL